ncbi:C2 domain-containing protein [Gaertneriomyces semiglobifer]|nr:C2 domain-containing protein [Gaertneriomyces semiglobifer]
MLATGDAAKPVKRIKGLLSITVLQATDLPKSDFIGANDNYVIISVNKAPDAPKVLKTEGDELCGRTQVMCGKDPIWNEKLVFPVETSISAIHVQVHDEDYDKDDLLGVALIDFAGSENLKNLSLDKLWLHEMWVDLRNSKGASAGKVKLLLHFVPESTAAYMAKKWDATTGMVKQKVTQKVVSKFTDMAASNVKSYFAV